MKGKEKDIQVEMSVETSKSKDVKTPSPPDRAKEFTAQMVALKAVCMNEISNLKNEIERLKQATYNQENNMNMENHSTVNLNYKISLLQRENVFIKTELNLQNDRVNEKNLKGNPLKHSKDKNSNGNPINNGKPDS